MKKQIATSEPARLTGSVGQGGINRLQAARQVVGQHLFDLAREQVALAPAELDESFEWSVAWGRHWREVFAAGPDSLSGGM